MTGTKKKLTKSVQNRAARSALEESMIIVSNIDHSLNGPDIKTLPLSLGHIFARPRFTDINQSCFICRTTFVQFLNGGR